VRCAERGQKEKKTSSIDRNVVRVVASQKRRRGRLHPTPSPPNVEGAAVDEYCRVLRGGQTSRDALTDAARVIAPEHTVSSSSPTSKLSSSSSSSSASSGRLLLTLIDAQFIDAYDLQVAALVDEDEDDEWPLTLTPGLHAVGATVPPTALAQMEGFRAEIEPIAAAPEPYALLAAAQAMADDGTASAALLTRMSRAGSFLSYQRLAKCENQRVKSTTLRVAVARTIGAAENGHPPVEAAEAGDAAKGTGVNGTSGGYSSGGGGGGGNDGGVHFIIVEALHGYLLGVVTFAPAPLPASCDFGSTANKPHSYCAGLPTALARTAVAIACRGKTGLRVMDPCCGSGTIVYEAWWGCHTSLIHHLLLLSYPQLECACFQPLNLLSDLLLSKFALQIQLVPLQRGRGDTAPSGWRCRSCGRATLRRTSRRWHTRRRRGGACEASRQAEAEAEAAVTASRRVALPPPRPSCITPTPSIGYKLARFLRFLTPTSTSSTIRSIAW
jgi:hypothetical protein